MNAQVLPSPIELLELGAHLARCKGCRGRWFAFQCITDALHDFVVRRFVTTVVVATALIGFGTLAL